MLIWINGPFGVGKTQVAHELKRKCPGSVIADPELLGFGIQRMYPPELRVDFQDTPWWMPTVADILIDVARRHPGDVIVPMTLHDEAGRCRDSRRPIVPFANHSFQRTFTLIAGRLPRSSQSSDRYSGGSCGTRHRSWCNCRLDRQS